MTLSRFALLVSLAAPALAQTETGQIAGTIRTAAGSPAASASIEVSSDATDFSQKATASARGMYNIPDLLPGTYVIRVTLSAFTPVEKIVAVPAGMRVGQDFTLGGNPKAEHLEEQSLSRILSGSEIRALPNLTRNPYQFAELAGNVSDAGLGTRGVGLAINGQREASTNIQLDGANNNDEFYGRIGQQIPLDAVQEITVLTSDFTAQFGRASGGIVNVVSRSGSNALHGSGWEFNRTSSLASNSFQNNATGVHPADFSRNQFGYAVGGPAVHDKLFFFSSTEGTLVHGTSTAFAWVPTPQFLAATAPATRAFFQSLGQLRSGIRTLGTASANDLTAIFGRSPCTGLACATLPPTLPLFTHVAYDAPVDGGGGFPQHTINTFQRIDYNLSDHTRIYARYALSTETDQRGVLSNSPYDDYDLGQTFFNQSFVASLIHTFSPRWVSQSKLAFSRLTDNQQGLTSRGVVPSMYANQDGPVAIGNDNVAFPGYNPFTPGSGGAFGGPQNILQAYHDVSWNKGSHSFRFGGSYQYIRDNRTDAAYQTAVDSLSEGGGIGPAINGLLSGQFAHISVAVNPQGKFPCGVIAPASPACSITLPVGPPNFSRSNRFHDGALYAQDSWKVRRRLSVNLGVRWEHFGVQHNGDPNLDSNWYAPGIGFADNNLGQYLRQGSIQLASKSLIGGLYKPDWKDFAPRVGAAWDLSGDGKTTLRAGYGIGYERNFGNVTFNVIQNPPNYAVLNLRGPITTNNFGPLATGSGTIGLPTVGARIIDPNLKTAYAHFWSASIEREIVRNVVYSFEYSGSKGVNLYSISYPNQNGFGNFALGDPCVGIGDCVSQPNPNYGESVGYRGNQGFSKYYGLNNRVTMNNFLNRGISLNVNYTWSHAIDNISSTFFEAGSQGIAGQFGSQNITTNNGDFVRGLLDPYHPNLDRGDADFDVRHRLTVDGNLRVPSGFTSGWTGNLLGGWSFSPLYTARSGQPFSVYDTSRQTLDLNLPRATFIGKIANARNSFLRGATPDTFHILTFLPAQIARVSNTLAPGSMWPADMSHRNAFRGPGWWNFDLALLKDTKLTERFTLQLRAEAFNLFNHANLYTEGLSANVGAGNTVDACYGCSGSISDRRQLQLAAKIVF